MLRWSVREKPGVGEWEREGERESTVMEEEEEEDALILPLAFCTHPQNRKKADNLFILTQHCKHCLVLFWQLYISCSRLFNFFLFFLMMVEVHAALQTCEKSPGCLWFLSVVVDRVAVGGWAWRSIMKSKLVHQGEWFKHTTDERSTLMSRRCSDAEKGLTRRTCVCFQGNVCVSPLNTPVLTL